MTVDMYLMISYSCFLVYQIHYLSEIPASITFSQFLSYFYHYLFWYIWRSTGSWLVFQAIQSIFIISLVPFVSPCSASMQFFCYVFYVLFVFYYIRLTRSILSFTSTSFSCLYATSSLDALNY